MPILISFCLVTKGKPSLAKGFPPQIYIQELNINNYLKQETKGMKSLAILLGLGIMLRGGGSVPPS